MVEIRVGNIAVISERRSPSAVSTRVSGLSSERGEFLDRVVDKILSPEDSRESIIIQFALSGHIPVVIPPRDHVVGPRFLLEDVPDLLCGDNNRRAHLCRVVTAL